MSRIGNIMAVVFAYTAVITLISMILGPYNPITERIAIGNEIAYILSAGTSLTESAEGTAISTGAPFAQNVEAGGTTYSFVDQIWNFVAGVFGGILGNILPEEIMAVLQGVAKFFGMLYAIVSVLWKIAVSGVALLGMGLANNSLTDVILGIFLLPMTLTVVRAIIEGLAYLLERIPLIGSGGGE